MRSFLLTLWCVLVTFAVATGCESMDESGSDEAPVSVDEVEQSLWRNLDKGAIDFGQTKTETLTSGDISHFYTFTATAGQTVTLAVEWALPRSTGLGAVIQIKDNAGAAVLAEHATLFSNQAHLTYTFATADTYRIYVKHYGYALFGSYPYKVGVEPDLCVVSEGTYDGFEQGTVNYYSASNFPERVTTDPWSFDSDDMGDEDFHETGHFVVFGNCDALVSTACGTAGPSVFEVWFPTGTLETVPNACEMRNDVYETAGDDEGWMLWWDTCSRYPEACQPQM